MRVNPFNFASAYVAQSYRSLGSANSAGRMQSRKLASVDIGTAEELHTRHKNRHWWQEFFSGAAIVAIITLPMLYFRYLWRGAGRIKPKIE